MCCNIYPDRLACFSMGAALQRRLKMRPLDNPVIEGMLNLLVTGALLNQRAEAEYAAVRADLERL